MSEEVVKLGKPEAAQVKFMAQSMYDFQKVRESIYNRIFNLKRDYKELAEVEELELMKKEMEKLEKLMELQIAKSLKIDIYTKWLSKIVGISTRYGGSLIAGIQDISNFAKVSQLWSYCGMSVETVCKKCNKLHFDNNEDAEKWKANMQEKMDKMRKRMKETEKKKKKPEEITSKIEKSLCTCENPEPKTEATKRRRGVAGISYNPFMKMTCWKIGKQFVRQGRFYRTVYEQMKAEEISSNEQLPEDKRRSKGHIDNRAIRKTIKIFLQHMYVAWRTIENLPVTKTYYEQYMKGHNQIELPMPDDLHDKI